MNHAERRKHRSPVAVPKPELAGVGGGQIESVCYRVKGCFHCRARIVYFCDDSVHVIAGGKGYGNSVHLNRRIRRYGIGPGVNFRKQALLFRPEGPVSAFPGRHVRLIIYFNIFGVHRPVIANLHDHRFFRVVIVSQYQFKRFGKAFGSRKKTYTVGTNGVSV